MFERFKRTHRTDEGASSVATRGREVQADAPVVDDRSGAVAAGETGTDDAMARDRFGREGEAVAPGESPGERDRNVVAGGGERDLAAGRSFERDDMARGTDRDADGVRDDAPRGTDRDADGMRDDAALDRDAARDDLRRDEADMPERDRDRHHGAGTAAAAAAGGAAAGAAMERHHDNRVRDDAARDEAVRDDIAGDDVRDRDFDRTGMRDDRAVAADADLDRDDRTLDRDRDADGVAEPRRAAPVMGTDALETMRARQRDRFGGIQWGSDFFGWLCAIGLASLLLAILVGAGVSLGVSTTDATNAASDPGQAQTIGIGGGIALLVVLAIAWFCGGYVAGRMARFDGARQGIGVWIWTLLAAVVVAALAAIGGSQYDIFQQLNLPRIAVGDSTLTAGGAIAGAAAILVTLVFAVIGGKVGERYHRRVDRVATHEYVADR